MGGTVYLTDEKLQVSRGLVRDAEVRNIFGFNTAIGTEFIAAWENAVAYVYPNTTLQMTAVSSNTSDIAVTILINGLDENYNRKSNTITLNGTSNVGIGEFFRINDVITLSGNALGNVTIANSGTTYAKVDAGAGKNQASIFTVPAGHEFYLYRIDAFCATASINNRHLFFRNFVRQPNGTILQVAQTSFLEQMNIQRRIPFRYAEKSDIQLQVRSSASTQEIGVFAEGILAKVPRTSVISG
jgi:acetyltransferase-like isoleucine patch superfamily enzyme